MSMTDQTNDQETLSAFETNYELLLFILPQNKSAGLVDYVRKEVHTGVSVFLGSGTKLGKFLRLFGLNEVHRDVVMIIQTHDQVEKILNLARTKLELHKPGHGIAFTIPLQYLAGFPSQDPGVSLKEKPLDYSGVQYAALCCILDEGLGEEAVTVAESAGAQGATILEAKGAGQASSLIFEFNIEPQKDFLLMILKTDLLDQVEDALDQHFTMENENTGIQFAYPVTRVVGLYEQEK